MYTATRKIQLKQLVSLSSPRYFVSFIMHRKAYNIHRIRVKQLDVSHAFAIISTICVSVCSANCLLTRRNRSISFKSNMLTRKGKLLKALWSAACSEQATAHCRISQEKYTRLPFKHSCLFQILFNAHEYPYKTDIRLIQHFRGLCKQAAVCM